MYKKQQIVHKTNNYHNGMNILRKLFAKIQYVSSLHEKIIASMYEQKKESTPRKSRRLPRSDQSRKFENLLCSSASSGSRQASKQVYCKSMLKKNIIMRVTNIPQ